MGFWHSQAANDEMNSFGVTRRTCNTTLPFRTRSDPLRIILQLIYLYLFLIVGLAFLRFLWNANLGILQDLQNGAPVQPSPQTTMDHIPENF